LKVYGVVAHSMLAFVPPLVFIVPALCEPPARKERTETSTWLSTVPLLLKTALMVEIPPPAVFSKKAPLLLLTVHS